MFCCLHIGDVVIVMSVYVTDIVRQWPGVWQEVESAINISSQKLDYFPKSLHFVKGSLGKTQNTQHLASDWIPHQYFLIMEVSLIVIFWCVLDFSKVDLFCLMLSYKSPFHSVILCYIWIQCALVLSKADLSALTPWKRFAAARKMCYTVLYLYTVLHCVVPCCTVLYEYNVICLPSRLGGVLQQQERCATVGMIHESQLAPQPWFHLHPTCTWW